MAGAELIFRSDAALTAPIIAVRTGLRLRASRQLLVTRVCFLDGGLRSNIQAPFEMHLEITLPSWTIEPAMLCEILLVCGNCRLRVLLANWVFQAMRSLVIVGGCLQSRGWRHTDMVAWTAGFAPHKALFTCVRPEGATARLAPARGLGIVLGRLSADVRRDADMIARPTGFAPDEPLGARIGSEIPDGEGASKRQERADQQCCRCECP